MNSTIRQFAAPASNALRGTPSPRSGRRKAVWLVICTLLAFPAPARAADIVNVGVPNSATDVIVYIAQKKGWFTDESLDVRITSFDSAARMIAPLAAGDLDMGSGGVSAGLFNAVGRGLGIRIVADKNSSVPGHGIQPFLVRRDHVTSGRFRTLADLKGMKISTAAPGTSASTNLEKLLARAGLGLTDIDQVYMGFPQQAVALTNKAIDASFTTEPNASQVIAAGAAIRVMGDDEIFPNHQLAVVLYSGDFITRKNAAAHRFMRAYLRAARFYNDAIRDGKLAGARGDEVVSILSEFIPLKDNSLYRSIVAAACDPDGTINMASLREDFSFFQRAGLIEGKVTVEDAVDATFITSAVRTMGKYERGR